MITKFWKTLFNDGERICTADNVYDSVTQNYWSETWESPDAQFFCINPIMLTRKDGSVTVLRNILIEFDNLSLEEQAALAYSIPFSTVTYSGSKSFHYIISLEEPCANITEYKRLIKRIQAKLPGMDTSTSNPSRLSRTPEAIRDNGVKQALHHISTRVSKEILETWLGPDLKTEEYNPIIQMPKREGTERKLPIRTHIFIERGALPGSRNIQLFTNACELFRANYTKEEIVEIAIRVLDLPLTEIKQCIESARKAVQNES